jgi:hypothetical protein
MAFPTDRIRVLAAATGLAGLLTSPAPAQSRNTYGLSDLKPYAGTLIPPAQVSAASHAAASHAAASSARRERPRSDPIVSLHAFGGAYVESKIGH